MLFGVKPLSALLPELFQSLRGKAPAAVLHPEDHAGEAGFLSPTAKDTNIQRLVESHGVLGGVFHQREETQKGNGMSGNGLLTIHRTADAAGKADVLHVQIVGDMTQLLPYSGPGRGGVEHIADESGENRDIGPDLLRLAGVGHIADGSDHVQKKMGFDLGPQHNESVLLVLQLHVVGVDPQLEDLVCHAVKALIQALKFRAARRFRIQPEVDLPRGQGLVGLLQLPGGADHIPAKKKEQQEDQGHADHADQKEKGGDAVAGFGHGARPGEKDHVALQAIYRRDLGDPAVGVAGGGGVPQQGGQSRVPAAGEQSLRSAQEAGKFLPQNVETLFNTEMGAAADGAYRIFSQTHGLEQIIFSIDGNQVPAFVSEGLCLAGGIGPDKILDVKGFRKGKGGPGGKEIQRVLRVDDKKSVHIAAYQQLVLHHIEHRGFGGNIHSRGPGKERCFAVQGEEKLINVLIDRACPGIELIAPQPGRGQVFLGHSFADGVGVIVAGPSEEDPGGGQDGHEKKDGFFTPGPQKDHLISR